MSSKAMKLVTVSPNGQISIGKAWAGRQIRVEEVSENEIHISAGTFVPDSQKEFFTKEANQSLDEFNQWEEQNGTPKESARDTLNRIRKERKSRGR